MSADERMLNDVAAINKSLKFMNIEDKELAEKDRIGENNVKRIIPRTLRFNNESNWSKESILKSNEKLTKYKKYSWAVYLSPEINLENSEKNNERLKTKRDLILEGIV